MAEAPGHLLGQIIGGVLEGAAQPVLQRLAAKHDLYLDSQGPRPGVRPGMKVTWEDDLGNLHDLDFVIERGGSASKRGNPAAFIETAWRRYTKHSKAKAQEIQGAVMPVLAKWSQVKPAAAAVVAGEWTAPSLQQMRTSGFEVLHLNFARTTSVFASHGIDIAGLGEGTPDKFWQQQVDRHQAMTRSEREQLAADLASAHQAELDEFIGRLESRMVRTIKSVLVLPLHGESIEYTSVQDAIDSVAAYDDSRSGSIPFVRFEVRIRYTNGDIIEASFGSAVDAIEFLRTFV